MSISRLSQRGQMPTTSPMSIAVFFLFYFTFIQVLVFMVEGIVPLYLRPDVSLLIIGNAIVIVGIMLAANIMEREITVLGTSGGGAPVSAWHMIHFGFLALVSFDIGIPLLDSARKSAMFTPWLIAIFIVIPFIAFTIAMYQIFMGSGGA